MRRLALLLIPVLALALGLLSLPLTAQMGSARKGGPLAAPVEQPLVEALEFDVQGPQKIASEAILAHIRLREGMPFNQAMVDASIRSLYETGLYEYIEANREVLPSGGLKMIYTIIPKFRISEIIFEGNDEFSNSRLQDQIKSTVGGVLDEVQIKRDNDKLLEYYQKKSFPKAKVDYIIERNEINGTGKVTFKIFEGDEIDIEEIRFVGNDHIEGDDLEDEMETSTWHMFSWITGGGRFKEETFQDDLDKLRTYYKNKGFLDVEIPESKVVFEYPEKDEMVIIIHVQEGRQYKVGNIKIAGNTIFPSSSIEEVLTLHTGDVFSPAAVEKNIDAIKDYYGRVGYLDTYIRAERRPNLDTGDIDLTFVVTESDKFYVESITITGNTKTKSNVIVRELALAPGDVFDLVRMRNSQARLQNTRFFDEVNLAPEATNIPGRRNLRITVKEGRTGNLTFGAGFSTVESIMGFVEVSQSNFDAFNYRNFFQGGGQKARLRFTLGAQSNQVLLGFEEPYIWEREIAFGFEIYRTETSYLSSTFDEIRMGFEVYLRKRLFELVEGRLSYRLEEVDIRDVTSDAAQIVKDEAGPRSISKVGFSLLRDTRDNLVFPTSGSRYELINEVAGGPLYGQTNYYRVEGRAGQWWPTLETGNQVFSVVGRVGSLIGYGNRSVPFYEKYYLGGPYNLRGFKYRAVSPRDNTGQEIGGKSMAFATAEYTIELIEPVRFAVFYDVGFVNYGSFNFKTDDYNDDFGVGLRILLLGAPMRIDLGFPVTKNDYQSTGPQFHFSFGTVF